MKQKCSSLTGAALAVLGAAPTWTTAGTLALLGLAGGTAAAAAMTWLAPVLIGLAVLLLSRAFYVLYVHGGTRASKAITWLSALAVAGFWTWRLLIGG